MTDIPKTTFSNTFPWIQMFEFVIQSQWSMFVRVHLTIIEHLLRKGLAPVIWTNDGLVWGRILASLGFNELKHGAIKPHVIIHWRIGDFLGITFFLDKTPYHFRASFDTVGIFIMYNFGIDLIRNLRSDWRRSGITSNNLHFVILFSNYHIPSCLACLSRFCLKRMMIIKYNCNYSVIVDCAAPQPCKLQSATAYLNTRNMPLMYTYGCFVRCVTMHCVTSWYSIYDCNHRQESIKRRTLYVIFENTHMNKTPERVIWWGLCIYFTSFKK